MPRGFMAFRFSMIIGVHSQVIECWDHFLSLFLYCLKTWGLFQSLLQSCVLSLRWNWKADLWVTWAGISPTHISVDIMLASDVKTALSCGCFLQFPVMNTKRHSVTENERDQPKKHIMPYLPTNKEVCYCWALLHQQAGGEGCAEPWGLLPSPELSSSGSSSLLVNAVSSLALLRDTADCLLPQWCLTREVPGWVRCPTACSQDACHHGRAGSCSGMGHYPTEPVMK